MLLRVFVFAIIIHALLRVKKNLYILELASITGKHIQEVSNRKFKIMYTHVNNYGSVVP